MQRGVLEAMQGHVARGRDAVAQARQELEELGQSLYVIGGANEAADIEKLARDPQAAEALLRPSLDRYSEIGDQAAASTQAGTLAHVLYDQGRLDEASALATRCQEAAPADDVMSQWLWRSAMAKIAARQDDDARALRLAEDALAPAAATDCLTEHADRFADLAEVHAWPVEQRSRRCVRPGRRPVPPQGQRRRAGTDTRTARSPRALGQSYCRTSGL